MNPLQTSLPGVIAAVQAAQSGSFSAAAQALSLTPAAVSKAVATLEHSLGVRLFNRTTRSLKPTEEGLAFLSLARTGLDALAQATLQASRTQTPQGLVRVSCSSGFGRRHVLPLLPGFFDQHRQISVELSLNDATVDLVGGGFDVGIRGGSEPPEGMVARAICKIAPVLVATPQYLAARGTPRHHRELAQHDLLRVRFLSGRVAPWLFKDSVPGAARQHQTIAVEQAAKLWLSDPESVLGAVLLHLGIGRIARHHAADAMASGELLELLPRQCVGSDSQMTIFYPHRQGLAPRVRVLVDYLLQCWQQDQLLHGA
jgi:DNA-binding transcriptional LysR family regulator